MIVNSFEKKHESFQYRKIEVHDIFNNSIKQSSGGTNQCSSLLPYVMVTVATEYVLVRCHDDVIK